MPDPPRPFQFQEPPIGFGAGALFAWMSLSHERPVVIEKDQFPLAACRTQLGLDLESSTPKPPEMGGQ